MRRVGIDCHHGRGQESEVWRTMNPRDAPSETIQRLTTVLADLVVLGELMFERMRSRLPNRCTELDALPVLFGRYGVQHMAAASALASLRALTAMAPYARSLYEATVNLMFIDEDSTGDRAAAYVAHSVATDEIEAESHVPGSQSAILRGPYWIDAVGAFPDSDTTGIESALQASRCVERDPRVLKHLHTFRTRQAPKLASVDWGAVVGHGTLHDRAAAIEQRDHYVGMYRTIYRHLSRDGHATNVLEGYVHDEDGRTKVRDIYVESTAKGEAMLDAVTGQGLSFVSHIVETHLDNEPELLREIERIRSAKRLGASAG